MGSGNKLPTDAAVKDRRGRFSDREKKRKAQHKVPKKQARPRVGWEVDSHGDRALTRAQIVSNHLGRGRAGLWSARSVTWTIGTRRTASLTIARATVAALARTGPITARWTVDASAFTQTDFKPIVSTPERAIGAPSTDARAAWTARRSSPTTIDEL